MSQGDANVPMIELSAAYLLINIVVTAAVVLDDPYFARIERIRYSCDAPIHFDAPFRLTD